MIMGKIFFHYNETKPLLRQTRVIRQNLEKIFDLECKNLKRVDIIFCTDDFLLKINKNFLNHDNFTDVITFPLHTSKEAITGEIYISVPRTAENSILHKSSPREELLRVLYHGCLHLCGFTDKSRSAKQKMTQREDYYLNLFKHSC